jgi:transcriptional regulator with XRE-family HTH domain
LRYEKYAKLRDDRGLTDYQVAKQTGISSATLSEWKSGSYIPKIDKIIKIADLFNVSLDSLLREE